MNNKIRTIKWGILGLGKIAHKFADDLLKTENCILYAVASRTLAKAETFAKTYGCTHAYGNYKNLAEDANIDAIYIATPHTFHKPDSILCLRHGKSVLCEKPMGVNYTDVQEMIDCAKRNNTLLMEALWTRFLPSYNYVKDLVENQKFGKVISIEADFGFVPEYNTKGRLFDKNLGGGSLLDIGIYPIFLALSIMGKPEKIEANATFFETGADSSVDIIFRYKDGNKANLRSTLLESTPTTATIQCEDGYLKLHSRFHEPTSVTVEGNEQSQTLDFSTDSHGYNFEILHFNQLIRDGKIESELMNHEFSKLLSSTMDIVKEKIGLKYKLG